MIKAVHQGFVVECDECQTCAKRSASEAGNADVLARGEGFQTARRKGMPIDRSRLWFCPPCYSKLSAKGVLVGVLPTSVVNGQSVL